MKTIIYFYQYLVFFYGIAFIIIIIFLTLSSFIKAWSYKWRYTKKEDEILKKSPYAPGISIIAPAFNEETTIITNVQSLLTIDYPTFEVVIVNDGSTDKTLELLINEFDLVETPYAYIEKVQCQPFKGLLKSTNPLYKQLTVVNKVNGGTKADASNAGINVSEYDYFVCTDVDCILSRDSLLKMIQPVLNSSVQVIAVGATMRMANSCEVNEEGIITRVRPPRGIIPRFQELEYLRSYLISKMGWSTIGLMPNVSGGIGLFDKSVVIEAGGYDSLSHAEDMDMLIRMITYMKNYNKPYKISHVPVTTCWTEGPPNLFVLNKQRTRWGRGLLQFFIVHRRLLFNRHYGKVGLVMLPYLLIFELLAPLVEFSGIAITVYFLFTNKINFETAYVLLSFIFLFFVLISAITVVYDLMMNKLYNRYREYVKLFSCALIEIFIYHPFIIFFNVKGYIDFLFKQRFEWGAMKRQGVQVKQREDA